MQMRTSSRLDAVVAWMSIAMVALAGACAPSLPAATRGDAGEGEGEVGDESEGEGEVGEEGEGEGEVGEEGEGEGEVGEEGEGEGEVGEEGEGEGEGDVGEGEASRCVDDGAAIDCAYETTEVDGREVHWQVPSGTAPPSGWPVVVFFQGSLFSAELSFAGQDGDGFGRVHLARTFAALLDAGYAVVAPEAWLDGSTAWQTNVPPASLFWEGSTDDAFLIALFAVMNNGDFGALDASRWYAMGISSGGFMTSRMAVSYGGVFRALMVASAGYATCSALCVLPSSMPTDHPPTLFLHGGNDVVVTTPVMRMYRDALSDAGIEVEAIVNDDEGHAWLPDAVAAVPAWFDAH
jgi:poly(3-hydroxyoctanoate) depolymerase